jgi:xanthine/CO dehydrogenase XdhC/CoxF family maturation factor
MAPPVIPASRELSDLRSDDFEASLGALDGDALRAFLRGLDPKADHRGALVEFAAKHAGGAPYLEPDPKLCEDAARVVRGCKRRGDHNRPEVRRILERARRLLLRGDVADARNVYELVLGSAADLASADRREHDDSAIEADHAGFAHAGSYLVSVYESATSSRLPSS